MKKIGVAGLQREQIKKTIEATAPGCFEVFIHNDMEAAMKVKSGQLDYYIGACNTGAGAALSPPPLNMYLPTIWIRSTAGVVNTSSSPGLNTSMSPPGCRPT